MINNGIEPVAISGSQEYNFAKNTIGKRIPNVSTTNSEYGIKTSFCDATMHHKCLTLSGDNINWNFGQVFVWHKI